MNIFLENRLPDDGRDPQFGVPQQKKYPLYDKEHVISAIKLFGHVEPRFEEQLAQAIISKMKKYNIPYTMVGEDNKLFKYIPKKYIEEYVAAPYTFEVLSEEKFNIDDYDTAEEIGRALSKYQDKRARLLKKENEYPAMVFVSLDNIIKKLTDKMDEFECTCKKKENIKESVLDPVQKTRCLDIFDKDGKMKEDVRKFITDTFMNWKNELVDNKFSVDGIYLIGSSASYQYTDTSDVDITIVSPDFNENDREIIRMLPNGNNLPGTQRPVNYFIRADLVERLAENIYDITNNKWIKESSIEDVSIPQEYILELSKFFMNAIDLTLSEYNRDKMAYLEYKALDPKRVEISEEEKTDVMNKKLEEIKSDADAIRIGNHLIRGFIHDAYENEENYFKVSIEIANTTNAPQKSVNNLVYKCLEKYGYREKVDNFIKEATEFIEKESNKE